MTLGDQLRALRVDGPYGYLRLRDAALRAGVTPVQWSAWESGRERPARDLLGSRLCPMLGGDLGELLRLWDEWVEEPAPASGRSICSGRADPEFQKEFQKMLKRNMERHAQLLSMLADS